MTSITLVNTLEAVDNPQWIECGYIGFVGQYSLYTFNIIFKVSHYCISLHAGKRAHLEYEDDPG